MHRPVGAGQWVVVGALVEVCPARCENCDHCAQAQCFKSGRSLGEPDALIADPLAGEGNLLQALSAILKGERFFDPKLGDYLQERGLDWDPQLTKRELLVMQAVAEGLSDRQVAARIGLVYDTLKYVLKGVYSKLGVGNRVQASILLERMGVFKALED